MTQAFNLAQFANYLNTSGQVSTSGLQSGIATQWTTISGGAEVSIAANVLIGGTGNPGGAKLFVQTASNKYVDIRTAVHDYLTNLTSAITFSRPDGASALAGVVGWDQGGIALSSRERVAICVGGPSAYNNAPPRYMFNINGSRESVITNGTTLYPDFTARAWVNFNGLSGSVGIRASGNVSSVTRNSTGNYTATFATAMPDANYAVCCSGGGGSGARSVIVAVDSESSVPTTTTVRFQVRNADNSDMDADRVFFSIFR